MSPCHLCKRAMQMRAGHGSEGRGRGRGCGGTGANHTNSYALGEGARARGVGGGGGEREVGHWFRAQGLRWRPGAAAVCHTGVWQEVWHATHTCPEKGGKAPASSERSCAPGPPP